VLRIAVPNKGSLAEGAAQILREAGYRQRADSGQLTCRDSANDIEFFYLRPRDIATYVGSGDLHLGITGRDLLVDTGGPAEELVDLKFGAATFRFAARPGMVTDVSELAGLRIATSYAGVVTGYLRERGIAAEVIRLDGAVENAVGLGVADVVADVVQTGRTLREAGLEPVGEPILQSSAVLIGGPQRPADGAVTQLLRRLQGVLVARQYVMLAYDVHADRLEKACRLTPGIESPTISPLHREGWVAVQAMVLQAEVHRIMDELYELGARAILVTNIHACRL
jgi:ATP phosphoribosyltransferase